MVQFIQIATANASALLLLMILKIHEHKQLRNAFLPDARLLWLMIKLTMFQCFFDTLVFWIDGKEFSLGITLNYWGNVIYYILNISIAYLWLLFMDYKMNGNVAKLKRLAWVMGIPFALTVVLIISSVFNGFIFTITEDNRYLRTSWHFIIPTILILFYVFFGTIRIAIHRKKKGSYMIFPALYFITPITLAVIVQSLNYGISLIFIGIAIGLTGVYLSTQNESVYIDQLCGIYNRRYYSDYIRAFCNSRKKTMLTGVLIDMDNFKTINDHFGHNTGDAALVQFSAVLRRHMNGAGFAARYGGDEFILITERSAVVAKEILDDIESELTDMNASGKYAFQLGFSYGLAEMTEKSSPEEFLKLMDGRMYEMKQERKCRESSMM